MFVYTKICKQYKIIPLCKTMHYYTYNYNYYISKIKYLNFTIGTNKNLFNQKNVIS